MKKYLIFTFGAFLMISGFAFVHPAHAAITMVQSTTVDCNGYCGGSTITFPRATTAGDTIIITFTGQAYVGYPTVSDAKNGTYSVAVAASDYDGGNQTDIFYMPNAQPVATTSLSVGYSTYWITAYEFSGLKTSSIVDQTSTNPGATYGPVTSFTDNVTTTVAGDLLVGVGNTNTQYQTFDTSTLKIDWNPSSNAAALFASGVANSTGAYYFSGTVASGYWGRTTISMASFKAATGAPPTITSFGASPTAVALNGTSTLSWSVTGATSLSISPTIGTVTGTSTTTPALTTSTIYTLTATNSYGTSTATTSVSVSVGTLPAIVQSAKYQPGSPGTSITFTLGTTPVAGDILVAFTSYSQYGASRTISAPDGTWTQIDNQTLSNDSLATWWHPVLSGATTTYTFPITGSTEWQSGVIYEISGANSAAPINQHAMSTSASASSITTPSVTPSILNTLPLAGADTDSGNSLNSINSGWTIDQSAVPSYHATFGAHQNALTTDTTTPISNTFNFSGGSSGSVQSTILIAPSGSGSSPTITSFGALPTVVASAGTSTLSWNITNASSVAITPGTLSTSTLIGSWTVNPTSTTVYTITATNANGTSTATTSVSVSGASTTYSISSSSTAHWAWNDEIGWIDFYTTNTVTVTPTQLTGYASSSVGPVSLDCATSPSGNICGTSNYKVANDGSGNLSGWAWNDKVGWISFYWGNASANPTATTTALCQSYGSNYCGVQFNPTTGIFSGWAWNDDIGWISFNCSNTSSCYTSQFDVVTALGNSSSTGAVGTLDSETLDTGVTSGAEINSVTWQGNQPPGTLVGFQFAVSNSSSGPWNFTGPDGTSGTMYVGLADAPIPLSNYSSLSGRYFRYRIILSTNAAQTVSPRVQGVDVNWSP